MYEKKLLRLAIVVFSMPVYGNFSPLRAYPNYFYADLVGRSADLRIRESGSCDE